MDTSDLINAPKEFLRLYKAGKDAAKQGRNAQAHDLLRQAIEIDPYHEQVWLWLASVVETDDDRRVCFENVLELDPDNQTAKQQLAAIEQRVLADAMNPQPLHRTANQPKKRNRLRRILILLILIAVAIAVLAVGITV